MNRLTHQYPIRLEGLKDTRPRQTRSGRFTRYPIVTAPDLNAISGADLARSQMATCGAGGSSRSPVTRVRIKVAADLHPYAFVAVTREGGQWHREKFTACRDRVAGQPGGKVRT